MSTLATLLHYVYTLLKLMKQKSTNNLKCIYPDVIHQQSCPSTVSRITSAVTVLCLIESALQHAVTCF